MLRNLKSISNKVHSRQFMIVGLDLLSVLIAIAAANIIACSFLYIPSYFRETYGNYMLIAGISIGVNVLLGSYKSLWRYAGTEEMIRIIIGTGIIGVTLKGAFILCDVYSPPTFVIAYGVIFAAFMVATRFGYRMSRRIMRSHYLSNSETAAKVLIVGAGAAGSLILKEMLDNPKLHKVPVAFIDDDPKRIGRSVNGISVYGPISTIEKVTEELDITEVIIAIPSASKSTLKAIVEACKRCKCHVSILPGYDEVIDGKVSIEKVRDVDIKDLLGRDEIETDLNAIGSYLHKKVVLVTGGGGSIGSELCRQIAKFEPDLLILLDCYENNAYDLQNELLRTYKHLNLEVLIASVRDEARMRSIFKLYKPQIVFHAAAHKHVPLMENSPMEAIKNNVFGTYHTALMAHEYGAEKMVLISTDKAVNPTNIMGATKRVAERIVKSFDGISNTEFVAVRFGNVLGSNGSVIPLFKKQIAAGGPVTVTHPDIIRYFMTIPEAVRLVLQAGALAEGGEVFVLDMGDPVKITQLAEDLIKLSGYEPYLDIDVQFTGLRPGEKLFEELLMAEEGLIDTKHKKIFIGVQNDEAFESLQTDLQMLRQIVAANDLEMLWVMVQKLVPTYSGVNKTLQEYILTEEATN